MSSLLALLAKAFSMAISLVCGVLTARLILGGAGVPQYALYTLLGTLPSLLSFTDLGSGATIVNSIAASEDPRRDPLVIDRLVSVGRIQLCFATVTMAVNALLLLTGGWPMLFGEVGGVPNADLAAFLCMTIFCLGIPLGVWVRIQLGLRQNHVVILLQAAISPLTLLFVWIVINSSRTEAFAFTAAASSTATLLVAVAGLAFTAWRTSPLVTTALGRMLRPRRFPGAQVMHVGWPMLAQIISSPIAMSSQRYVLAQSGTHEQVAEYGLAAQVFFAFSGLFTAAGTALWPYYTNLRHRGELRRGPFALSALFAFGILAATGAVWLFNDFIFSFISDGALAVSSQTILAFGTMIALQGALYPMGMFIMDEPGIRFQVLPALLMAASTLGLAILLTPTWGAIGPLVANSFSVVVFQLIPFAWYIQRNSGRLLSSGESVGS